MAYGKVWLGKLPMFVFYLFSCQRYFGWQFWAFLVWWVVMHLLSCCSLLWSCNHSVNESDPLRLFCLRTFIKREHIKQKYYAKSRETSYNFFVLTFFPKHPTDVLFSRPTTIQSICVDLAYQHYWLYELSVLTTRQYFKHRID